MTVSSMYDVADSFIPYTVAYTVVGVMVKIE